VAPRAGNRRQKTDLLPVTTTTATALFEISSKQESASDRETANAVTLYASRKEASCIKKMSGNSVRLHTAEHCAAAEGNAAGSALR